MKGENVHVFHATPETRLDRFRLEPENIPRHAPMSVIDADHVVGGAIYQEKSLTSQRPNSNWQKRARHFVQSLLWSPEPVAASTTWA